MSIAKITNLAKGHPDYKNLKWKKVVAAFDALPVDQQAEAVEAFEAASTHWPSRVDGWAGVDGSPDYEMRRSPLHWVKEVYTGNHQPKHRLIRILESPRRPLRGQSLPEVFNPDNELTNVAQVGYDQVKLPGTFWRQLKGAGAWQRWRVLRLWTCELKPAQLKPLVKIDFSALESLVLTQNWLRAPGAKALATAPGFEGIKALEFSLNGIGVEGARELAGAKWLTELERAAFKYNSLDDEALEHLTEGGKLAQLQELDLSNNPLGPEPGRWAPRLPELRRLTVEESEISDVALAALIGGLDGAKLESLKTLKTAFGDASARALIDSGARLKRLDVRGGELTAEGASALIESEAAQPLEALFFGRGFTMAHVEKLAEGALPNLKEISWRQDEMDADPTAFIKSSPRLAKLYPYWP